jgi:predicted anti-sigma-YlaC factor YlaD
VSHPSEDLVDRYLDHDLTPGERARVESHLAECAICRADLAALAGLFGALDTLPAERMPVDLTPRVLARIASRPQRRRFWLIEAGLVAQVALTLALAAWVVPHLGPRLSPVAWPLFDLAVVSPTRLDVPLADLLSDGGVTVAAIAPLPLALVGALALALWLVGNRLALGGVAGPGRRRAREA